MKSVGKARNNGLYRHIRTSKEIIRNLLNDFDKSKAEMAEQEINKMISNRLDDTNNRQQTNRIVSAIQEK